MLDVGGNVRVVGRIESGTGPHRPSRGLLEQSWVVCIDPARAARPSGSGSAIDWSALQDEIVRRLADATPAAPGLDALFDLLGETASRPAASTGASVERFLAAAEPLMDPAQAVDCAVAWRILPGLSVEGESGRDLLDRLGALGQAQSWPRTTALLASIRAAGERTGGFYEGLVLRWD
jgi:hypothetical protein